ncbi:MAG TPA: phosphatase PAP2 family protein [Sphingomicrobium sp.]|nr:phosphatase PAP2 family protein [Sphingomicrobium sp.]
MPVLLEQRTLLLTSSRSQILIASLLGIAILSLTALLVGSASDAGLFLASLVANGLALLLLWRNSAFGRYLDRRFPSTNKRLLAFGLFAAGAVTLFAKIAEDVTRHESTALDRSVSLWVHRFDTPFLDKAMKGFSLLGTFDVKTLAVIVVLLWCLRRRDVVAFTGLLGVLLADEALSGTLKSIFERPRPTLFHEVGPLHSFSFPSGHSMAAVAAYGMIGAVVARLVPRARGLAIVGTLIIAFLIGYSRIYLGVHWFTDVLAGYSAGAAILFVGILWLESHPPFERALRTAAPPPGPEAVS